MGLNLDGILSEPIRVGAKGVPFPLYGKPLSAVSSASLDLLGPQMSFPLATIERGALDHNLAAMQTYLASADMLIAPHGKTTMCPQLFDLQINAGAWGITLASWQQARVALAYGVRRILIANQVVGEADLWDMAQTLANNPKLEVVSLVDSVEQLRRTEVILASVPGAPRLPVLVELGFAGGRCGVRDDAKALELAHALAASKQLALAGIEGYEGLLVSNEPIADAQAVSAFVDRLVSLFAECEKGSLFGGEHPPILSAGGSAYFDLVARGFTQSASHCRPILRSGCYLTHDVGFYDQLLHQAAARAVLGEPPKLRPALFVWAQVLSRPEPGLALVGLGRRDVSDDSRMPKPLMQFRNREVISHADGWDFSRMNDQHGYLSIPAGADVEVGDVLKFGISHPCTTFDRWAWLLETDGEYKVTGAFRSFF